MVEAKTADLDGRLFGRLSEFVFLAKARFHISPRRNISLQYRPAVLQKPESLRNKAFGLINRLINCQVQQSCQ